MKLPLQLWSIERVSSPKLSPVILSRVKATEDLLSHDTIYTRELELGRRALDQGNPLSAVSHLREARAQPGHERAREVMKLWGRLYTLLPRKAFRGWWHEEVSSDEYCRTACLSLDGSYALLGLYGVKRWEFDTGKLLSPFVDIGQIDDICISPDGKYVLTCDEYNAILWDAMTGQRIRDDYAGIRSRKSVSISQDNRFALIVGRDWNEDVACVFEILTGHLVRTIKNVGPFDTFVFNSDGQYLLSQNGYLWNLASGRRVRALSEDWSSDASLSSDGRYVLCGYYDGTLKLLDFETGSCLRVFEGHQDRVDAVCLTSDNRFAFSNSADGTLKLWDGETGNCLRTFEGEGYGSICVSPDGRYVLAIKSGKIIRLFLDWELEERPPADWDEGARPYLNNFLSIHTPYAFDLPEGKSLSEEEAAVALRRKGKPRWSEEDFSGLLFNLGCAGYGWLRPEGVRRELEAMAATGNQ